MYHFFLKLVGKGVYSLFKNSKGVCVVPYATNDNMIGVSFVTREVVAEIKGTQNRRWFF